MQVSIARRRRTACLNAPPIPAVGRADRGDPAAHVVTVGPNEKHWHGAAPMTTMTHIAIQEALDGKNVDWLEKVTDEQYNAERKS